jgi:hypothetical protein
LTSSTFSSPAFRCSLVLLLLLDFFLFLSIETLLLVLVVFALLSHSLQADSESWVLHPYTESVPTPVKRADRRASLLGCSETSDVNLDSIDATT